MSVHRHRASGSATSVTAASEHHPSDPKPTSAATAPKADVHWPGASTRGTSDDQPRASGRRSTPERVTAPDDVGALVASLQPRLRQVLASRYGPEIGHEAADEAVAWALANPARMAAIEHPLAYLCRVGQSKARPSLRWLARRSPSLADDRIVAEHIEPIDPELVRALTKLPPDHRSAVMLVHAYDWTIAEVAAARGVPITTVTNHLRRGLHALRSQLQETKR